MPQTRNIRQRIRVSRFILKEGRSVYVPVGGELSRAICPMVEESAGWAGSAIKTARSVSFLAVRSAVYPEPVLLAWVGLQAWRRSCSAWREPLWRPGNQGKL